MPAGGEAKAVGMIENCDAKLLAVDRTMIIDPFGRLGPCIFVCLAATGDDLSALLRVDIHRGWHSHPKGALFGVAEFDGAAGCYQLDRKIDPAGVRIGAELQRSLVL